MKQEKILILEDSKEIRELIAIYLNKEGFQVIEAETGFEALKLFETEQPDLLLVDITLQGMDGAAVCAEIRQYSNVPIIFVTARKDSEEIVQGLEMGADDYITKPFDPVVLVARVKANLRRAPIFSRAQLYKQEDKKNHILSYDGLEINTETMEVRLQGTKLLLSAKETQLLMFLAKRPEQVFAQEELYRQIWGAESYSDTRTVSVHISSLRKKLESNPELPQYIHNVRGLGYKFSAATGH
ncbi:response regulator transcription factor [Paenibacillus thermotolerans]|uniref:response regulator transcription factor n=1 Tax=Paenibacillus thermotolerans TaxID=3027807 RepID=UPI002368EE28|nr:MULTISPECIES: response regulator transcription factor [unclassified Paenibacillus]